MKLKLLFFGVLTDVIGAAALEFSMEENNSTALNCLMQHQYPELAKYSYKMAVNQEIISEEKLLKEGDEVAFLPPFSGG